MTGKFYDENRLTMNVGIGQITVRREGCDKCPHCRHTERVVFEAVTDRQMLSGEIAAVVWDAMKAEARRNSFL